MPWSMDGLDTGKYEKPNTKACNCEVFFGKLCIILDFDFEIHGGI